jgi:hypothetical protein
MFALLAAIIIVICLAPTFTNQRWAWVTLTVGQVLSVLGCVGAIAGMVVGWWSIPKHNPLMFGLVLLGGFLSFCYSQALFFVFYWIKKHRKLSFIQDDQPWEGRQTSGHSR